MCVVPSTAIMGWSDNSDKLRHRLATSKACSSPALVGSRINVLALGHLPEGRCWWIKHFPFFLSSCPSQLSGRSVALGHGKLCPSMIRLLRSSPTKTRPSSLGKRPAREGDFIRRFERQQMPRTGHDALLRPADAFDHFASQQIGRHPCVALAR